MPNKNLHEVCGHVGRPPEVRVTSTGRTYCRFSVATNNNYPKNGKWVEVPPSWHQVVIWGDLAELVAEEFKKGDAVMVRGKSHTRSFTKNGQKAWLTELTAFEVYRPIYVRKAGSTNLPDPEDPWNYEETDMQEQGDEPDFPFGGCNG